MACSTAAGTKATLLWWMMKPSSKSLTWLNFPTDELSEYESSVRPKPGFGIGNRNQDQGWYQSLNFFYLNQNFLYFLFIKIFSCFLCLVLNISQVIQSYHEACVWIITIFIENAKLVTKSHNICSKKTGSVTKFFLWNTGSKRT